MAMRFNAVVTNACFRMHSRTVNFMSMRLSNEAQRRVIQARRGQAEMLLASATHHATREQVQLALRDLDEAMTWLDSNTCVGPVDVLVDLAAWRLNTIRDVLRDGEANTALLIPNPRGPER